MENKGSIYVFLMFCIAILAVLAPVDADSLPSFEEVPQPALHECTVGMENNCSFAFACEPFQSPVSILVDKRKLLDKCESKSLSKFIKLRDLYTLRPVSRFEARSYSLHNLFIPHNSSLSQLQTFII